MKKTKAHKPRERRATILKLLQEKGRVSVDEISLLLGATPQTIRKDLSHMDHEGCIMRVHGGAMLLAGNVYTAYEARTKIASKQKTRIGLACAGLIPNNALVSLNAGTTIAAVARHIKYHTGLRVVVDSVSIANEIKGIQGIEVIVPGGSVRPSDGTILGETVSEFIRQFRFDVSVVGAAAIDSDGALLDFDLHEAATVKAMIEKSRHTILAVDSMKFGRAAPVQIGHLSQIQSLVTDEGCPENFLQIAQKYNIQVVRA